MASAPTLHDRFARNEGRFDRALRVGAGLVLLALGLTFGSWWGLVGLVPLVTGLVGYCPVYALFGISTCPLDRR
jgi:hypothetical protein